MELRAEEVKQRLPAAVPGERYADYLATERRLG